MSFAIEEIRSLLAEQRRDWPLLMENHAALQSVRIRTLALDGFAVRLQYNSHRLRSTGARVDGKSIRERACFLCSENLPQEQRGIPFGEDYMILCNPFPVFNDHLTIRHVSHLPQLIAASFPRMLDLVEEIGESFVVTYNGPDCGASAPDHLHFQAGERGVLPLEAEYEHIKATLGRCIVNRGELQCHAIDRYLCPVVSFEARSAAALAGAFSSFYEILQGMLPGGDEPMMNILVTREDQVLRVLIMPRAKHRPSFFFAEGDEKLLLSPAAIDLGGIFILPVLRDFERLSKEHLIKVSDEVCLKGLEFEQLCRELSKALKG